MEVENLAFRKRWQSFDAKENGSLICCYDTNNVPKQSSKDPFPSDIIYKILSRLPIKSLARFRCVCKLWLDYINDPYLHKIHVKEEPTPIMFQRFPRGSKIIISFLRGVQEEPVLELCYKAPGSEHLLLGSCNGLTLVSYEQDPCKAGIYRFAVINPLTKQRHDLPSLSIKIRPKFMQMDGPYDAAGIGFDDSTNTLKTVFIILKGPHFNAACTTTMVHTLGMSSWRKVARFPAYLISGDGVFGHGRLHWLNDDIDDVTKIVWFDVKEEEFGVSYPPEPINPIDDGYTELVDLNGEVGFAYVSPICIKLWILKQEEEWVLHCCFDFSLIPGQYYYCDVAVLGCWNKDGDILLTCKGGERLFVYSLESGDLRQVLEQQYGHLRMYQSSLFSLHTSAYYTKAIGSRVRGGGGELGTRPGPWKRGKTFHRNPGTFGKMGESYVCHG